jgi:putative metallohydrolase (TIGR04338 family)
VQVTKLQQAAYDAQLAAALPVSELASAVLISVDGRIGLQNCATYILAVQEMDWFTAAFPSHLAPVAIRGGRGGSNADAPRRRIKIGTNNRFSIGECEQACLHELAHIVSPDYGPGKELREPRLGRDSSKGHHHAWRANFVLIVRKVLGRQAAARLRSEFNQWGLPTTK